MKINFAGVYPPITTPFNQDESIAWNKLEENLTKMNTMNLRGYLVQGSNGEYCYLSAEERVEMIRKVREFSAKDKLVLAGSGCESTAQTIDMTKKMAEAGADAAVVITPFYFKNKMNSEALRIHFTSVADASPIPVLLYSVPANTGLDLPVDLAVELSKHPNIVGMKDSGGDIAKIGQIIAETGNSPDNFCLLAGSASFLLPALNVGAVGGICALANALPEECCNLQDLFYNGKHEEAMKLQHRLIAPNGAVTKKFGVPGLKQAMEWVGFYGGPSRKPLLDLHEPEKAALRKTFSSNEFL